MSVFDRIVDTLKNQSIEFDLLTHEPVHTSQEAAAVRGSELDQGAKALLCIADGTPVLLVVPGSQKVDTRRFKQAFGFKNLRFATTDEVLAITSVAVGAVPRLVQRCRCKHTPTNPCHITNTSPLTPACIHARL